MADPKDQAAEDERLRKARADRAAAAEKAAAATAGTKDVEADKAREVREAQEADAAALTAGEIPPDPSQEVADAIRAGTYHHDAEPQGQRRDAKADDQRAGYKTR